MKQIIAMGGGGFSMEPDNPLLDKYILNQSNSTRPKICFIPTASGDADGYIQKFYDAFRNQTCVPSHLSLFRPATTDLEDFVLEQDVLYVGGGNTRNLLILWKAWGLDRYVRKAWENGVILAGLSAGAICWFEEGVTDSFPGQLSRLECLGLLQGSSCPHFNGEDDYREGYHRLLRNHEISNGIALDDGAAVHYRDDRIYRIVSSRRHAKAYQVEYRNEQVVERELDTVFLGESGEKD